MLNLSSGPLKIADSIAAPMNEGASCIEDPPETPAHVFALRAFKTAIFGTPHLEQQIFRNRSQASANAHQQEQDHRSAHVNQEKENGGSVVAHREHAEKCLTESVASPAKGILLTPGMGTSKRKNVSFMQAATQEQEQSSVAAIDENLLSQDDSPIKGSHQRDQRPRPSSLTKTLIELSNQRANKHLEIQSSSPKPMGSSAVQCKTHTQDDAIQTELDQTVDLSQPRSRSGQHWKTEFEQYFRRSDREMKKIINHGQNVKSFAVKKDSEAATLTQKLQEELARIEAVELKAAKMAKRLSIAQSEDTKGNGDHARLVSELAQQTALALRYKRKADEYRRANQQRSSASRVYDIADESQIIPDTEEDPQDAAHSNLGREIKSLQKVAKDAEERAGKIEAENGILKRSLARVKTEMMSYETRRQAREDCLKKREETHKKARETAEVQLQKLRIDYQNLQHEKQEKLLGSASYSHGPNMQQSLNSAIPADQPALIKDLKADSSSFKETRALSKSRSPRRRRQKPPIDIWTLSSPHENEEQSKQPYTTASTELPPSSVGNDIKKALKEIDLNLVPDQTLNPAAERQMKTKEPIDFEDGVPIFPSTSPVPTSDQSLKPKNSRSNTAASSPARLQLTSSQLDRSPLARRDHSTVGRSGSMLVSGGGGRTSIMGSTRSGGTMTAERAAAAKERLARRSAEKRKMRG